METPDLTYDLDVAVSDDGQVFRGSFVNTTSKPWLRGKGKGELLLGWRILRQPTRELVHQGRGAPLPATIAPGKTISFEFVIDLSSLPPGTHVLEVGLLREFAFWFQDRGLGCWRLPILVKAQVVAGEAGAGDATGAPPLLLPAPEHPYRSLPDRQFWRRAVLGQPAGTLRPVAEPPFAVSQNDRIATAGSCFAQNVALFLEENGFRYVRTEPAPPLSTSAFSANYGNIYTTRQLKQLLLRSYGLLRTEDVAWRRADGRFIDPFRPQLFPDGFASAAAVREAADVHLRNVRRVFEESDVFIFTLGLTETWTNLRDGTTLPLPPGVVATEANAANYGFINLSAEETASDLRDFVDAVRLVNPNLRIILTVSPVPIIATFEDRHVLVANGASKAALRVAAEMVARQRRNVAYFGSYEIITSPASRGAFYADDLRSVTAEGVRHVMNAFREIFIRDDAFAPSRDEPPVAPPPAPDDGAEREALRRVLCDEAMLEPSSR